MRRLQHLQPLVLLAFSSMALLSGCKEAAAPAQAKAPQAVEVIELHSQVLALTTELPGRTVAYRIAQVRPQVSGIIREVNFTEGSEVKKGQGLYQIDPSSYDAAFSSAKANLMSAKAEYSAARLKADKYGPLAELKAISKLELIQVESARQQAEAKVAAAQSALDAARINLHYTAVVSPIDGRSGRSTVSEGALVTADQGAPLTTVQQLDPILVDVTQSSNVLLKLRRDHAGKAADPGDTKVKLILDDGSVYEHEGSLQFSEVTVDQTTGSVTLRAKFPNPDQFLLPGMFVHMQIQEGVDNHALLIPQEALTHDAQGVATALVANTDDTAELRKLTSSRAVGNQWLISSGLEEGDRVIVSGMQHVHPGDKVAPKLSGASRDEPANQTLGTSSAASAG